MANKNIYLAIAILAILVYFGYSDTGSILTGNGVTNEIKTESWLGNQVELQSSFFGQAISKASVKVDGTWVHYDFCSDNDGTLTISNYYNVGEQLEMRSAMSSADKGCNQENYIKSTMTLPKGTLTVTCNLKAIDRNGNDASAKCVVGSESLSAVGTGYSKEITTKDSFDVEITEEKEITVYLYTHASQRGSSASGQVILAFEKDVIETEDDTDTNIDDADYSSSPTINTNDSDDSSTTKLSFIDKINLWIENFFDSIFGIFK